MKRMLFFLPILFCACFNTAWANWEYDSEYVASGWYVDDGSRFILSLRGGASYGIGKIKNDIGGLSPGYYYNDTTDSLITDGYYKLSCTGDCRDGYVFAGYGNIGDLPAKEEYKKLTFAAGASIGWVIPYRSNWRLEIGWDKISEADYNSSPLFDGDITLWSGALDGESVPVQSGSVQSTVETDIISVMAFYDFFDGLEKPLHVIIPYVGAGVGYADSKTEMLLTDAYGDLSLSTELFQYGEGGGDTAIEFYKSKTSTSSIAGVLAVGVSYGIAERMFLDFGVRLMYVPKIKWALSSEDETRHRDWFSAENVIYTNVLLGLRFEF